MNPRKVDRFSLLCGVLCLVFVLYTGVTSFARDEESSSLLAYAGGICLGLGLVFFNLHFRNPVVFATILIGVLFFGCWGFVSWFFEGGAFGDPFGAILIGLSSLCLYLAAQRSRREQGKLLSSQRNA